MASALSRRHGHPEPDRDPTGVHTTNPGGARLHRRLKDGHWKDRGIRSANPAEMGRRPLWYLRPCAHADARTGPTDLRAVPGAGDAAKPEDRLDHGRD